MHLERERPVGQASDEVLEGLALHGRDQGIARSDGVVAGRKGHPLGSDTSAGEAKRVALPRVDLDRESLGDRATRGILAPGFAAFAAFCVCQKIAGRPRVSVKTNCERERRGRSSTRSITAPRLRHITIGVSSRTSALSGQPFSKGWQ